MRRLFVPGVALALALGGCGGGSPLLHPVHALPSGQTSFGAGMSDRLVLGTERSSLDFARDRIDVAAPPADPRYARGVLVALAEGPALAPWASARVGIVGSNEAGLSFTGSAARADARHAFDFGSTAFSAGLGLSARGFGSSALELPGSDLDRVNGYGLDLPLLFGYRTDADLISVWAGLRGAYDHWSGKVALDSNGDFDLGASRFSAGPIVGLAVGVAPIYAAAELELDYAHVTGTMDRGAPAAHDDAAISGWSLRPAGALIAKF
ncbi:MAG TPA: hypothetical protein VGM44_10065 [Polyangiaceae bacterium]